MISSPVERRPRRHLALAAAALVALAAFLPFAGALRHGFVDRGDAVILRDPGVRELTWASARETLARPVTRGHGPLTVLSFAADHALWGPDPFGFHLTSLLLHVAGALLVLALVTRLAARLAAGTVAALLFAVHPLRAEPVAWVAARAHVLAAPLFLAALLAYLAWRDGRRAGWYAAALAAFVLSLLATPGAATLPLVLLLCDDLRARQWSARAIVEKLPFFALGALAAALAAAVRRADGDPASVAPPGTFPGVLEASERLLFYLGKTIAPLGLSAFYPASSGALDPLPPALAPLVLAALATGLWLSRRATRHVTFGGLFFVVTLLPALGGAAGPDQPAVADRHTYLPSVGLAYLAGVAFARLWGGTAWRGRAARLALGAAAGAVVLALAGATARRCEVWRDTGTLWRSVLDRDPEARLARYRLGILYADEGRLEEAIEAFRTVVARDPDGVASRRRLADAYRRAGRLEQAAAEYRRALGVDPSSAQAHHELGLVLKVQGHLPQALGHLQEALTLEPENRAFAYSLVSALQAAGRLSAATAVMAGLPATPPDADGARRLADGRQWVDD